MSDVSPVSSVSDDTSRLQQQQQQKSGSTVRNDVTTERRQPPPTLPKPGQRMSPAMLQQRLGGELGFLESTEETLRQLTEVERTRAVSLAQQESVSLAQIVKAQKLGFDQQVARIQGKIHQEDEAAHRRFEETQKRATEHPLAEVHDM